MAAGVVIALVVVAYWWQRPLIRTGTGFAAHNACGVEHVAKRTNPADDLPPSILKPLLRLDDLDDSNGEGARASIIGGLSGQQAFDTPGFGCTIAHQPPDLPDPISVGADANPFAAAEHVSDVSEFATEIGHAFGDDLSPEERNALGTRAIVVVRDGELIAERYEEGFDSSTRQLGWSMTKSVTSLMVGRLVQQDLVSLDDDRLRPEWDDARAEITIEHLLTMTSGLGWDETYALGTPVTEMLYANPDMASYVAGRSLQHQPGSFLQYSTGNTNLLCEVVGRRTGRNPALLPAQLIFEPLGLSSAVLEPDGAGNPVCGAYMWATPRDWAAVGQFALQEGVWDGTELLPKDWMGWSTVAVTAEGEQEGYAAGWWANRTSDGTILFPEMPADTYFAHGKFGQWLVVVPSADLVVVRLGFTPERADHRVPTLVQNLLASG